MPEDERYIEFVGYTGRSLPRISNKVIRLTRKQGDDTHVKTSKEAGF